MIDTPRVMDLGEQPVALVHIDTPRSKMREVMGPGVAEAMAAARSQGLGPAGPWFAHHLKISADDFVFDICVPVSSPIAPMGRAMPATRPASSVLRTTYHGAYEGLGAAWQEFDAWAAANGYETSDDLFERYVVGPESGPDCSRWRTELSRSIRTRAS